MGKTNTRDYKQMLKPTLLNRELFPYTLRALAMRVFAFWLVLSVLPLLIAFLSVFHPATATAATTPANDLNFQARLETSAGAIAPDGTYNVEFKLYNASSGGTALWTEDYLNSNSQGVTVADGYLTANLGSLITFPNTINWSQQLYLTMNIGGTNLTTPTWDGEMNPRIALTAVPYAFQAQSADQLQQAQSDYTGNLSFATLTGGDQNFVLPDQVGAGTYNLCIQASVACGFAPGTAGSYVQNGTILQTGANFDIQATDNGTTGTVGGIIRGAAGGQTADLLQLQSSGGTVLSEFDSSGNLHVGNSLLTNSYLKLYAVGGNVQDQIAANGNDQLTIGNGGGNFYGVRVNGSSDTLNGGRANLVVRQASSGTNDAFQIQNSSGNPLTKFNTNGDLQIGGANSAASATALQVQNSGGTAVLDVDTSTNTVMVGGTLQGNTLIAGSSTSCASGTNSFVTSNGFTTCYVGGNIGVKLTADGSGGIMLLDNNNNLSNGNFRFRNSSNGDVFQIKEDGTATASVALQAPLFDTATAAALNIGTTNATSINLNQNTVVANGKTLSVGSPSASFYGYATGASFAAHADYANSGGSYASVASADFNGDGHTDIVATEPGSSKISVFMNNGDGTFASKVEYSVGSGAYSVVTADVNKDGCPDIISNNYNVQNLSVLINNCNGTGTFQPQVTYGTAGVSFSLTAADVNQDGYPDLVVASYGGNVLVFLNNGNGTFAAPTSYSSNSNYLRYVTVADVNGDSHPDIVTANGASNNISVLINNGDGTFTAGITYSDASFPMSVTTADVNGDGHPDIIAADNGASTVSVFLNSGTGTFGARTTYSTTHNSQSVTTADVNGDGHPDIIATETSDNTVSVFLNSGTGTFVSRSDYMIGEDAQTVITADVNGDGKPDIVTANSGSTVSVLINGATLLNVTGAISATAPTANNAVLVLQGAVSQAVDYFRIQDASASALFSINKFGYVGIGNANPQYKLDVVGDLNISVGSSYRVGGTAGSTTTCVSGDYLDGMVIQGGIVTGGTCTAVPAGGGGGTLTGSGTAGTVALFTGTGSSIGNSILTQQGTSSVTVGGVLVANALQAASLDTASAGTLTIGGTNATGGINLNQNVTVASGKTLTATSTGSGTAITGSSSSSGSGIYGTNNGSGSGVYGSAGGGSGNGVYGFTGGSGAAVRGSSQGTGAGVYGTSTGGTAGYFVNGTVCSGTCTSDSAPVVVMRQLPAYNTGDIIQLQGNNSEVFDKYDLNGNYYSYGTNSGLLALATPTITSVTNTGTAGTTTYGYRVSAVNAQGETVASAEVTTTTGNATLSTTNYNTISWNSVPGASTYKVYGRTAGAELYMATINSSTNSYKDQGAATPSGALPSNPVGTTLTLQGWQGQTGYLLQFQNSSGTPVAAINTSGDFSGRLVTGTTLTGTTAVNAPSFDVNLSGPLTIGTSTRATSITMGSTSFTGALTLGQSTQTNTINIGSANLSGSNVQTINIGAPSGGSGYENITIGKADTASVVSVNAGVMTLTGNNGISLNVNGTGGGGAVVKSVTNNSTTAFQIQSSSGSSGVLLTADTANMRVSIGSLGIATGQLYVGGALPAAATGSATFTNSRVGHSLYVQGNYVYTADYASGNNGIEIYDATNPAAPALVNGPSGMSLTYGVTESVVQGHYLYTVGGSNANSFHVVDVSNPKSPVDLVQVNVSSLSLYSIYVQGRYAYINDSGGTLYVYDISNPAAPKLAGSLSGATLGITSVHNYSVYVQGKYAYMTSYSPSQLFVIDVSNPASPVWENTTTTATAGNASQIVVSGRYAYVTEAFSGKLQVFNISDPTTPVSVANSTPGISGNAISVAIQGRYAYVLDDASHLYVIDISNPTAPNNLGAITTAASPSQVVVSGRYAYVSAASLQIFDLGGAYVQQLQSGGAEVGSLQVDNSANVAGDASIQGGLAIGQSLQVGGGAGVNGSLVLQNANTAAIAATIQAASGQTADLLQFSSGGSVLSGFDKSGNVFVMSNGKRVTITTDGSQTTPVTLTIPAVTGSDTFCLKNLANCGSGGGGGTTTITLSPEFAGAVFHIDPASANGHTGTMTTDRVDGLTSTQGYKHNYYAWTTDQTTAQDYDIVAEYQLPSNFTSFAAGTWKAWVYADVTGGGQAINYTVKDAQGDSCASGTLALAAGTWQQSAMSDPSTTAPCSFTKNDIITIDFKLTAIQPSTNYVKLGEVQFSYN